METSADASKVFNKSPEGFIKHMTSFDEDSKCQLMNMIQYALLSIIPAVIILKAVKQFIPEEDESKGTIEITAECVAQLVMIVVSIWFFNRLIMYIPTYSSCEYNNFDATNFILPLVILMITMQTKLGAKIEMLIDRIFYSWYGRNDDAVRSQQVSGKVSITQPLAGQYNSSQADTFEHPKLLPSAPGMTSMPQQSPDFNQMHSNNPTQLPNAQTPGESFGMMDNGPLAANESLGSSFSSW
jgi:hypothetical protein